MNALSQDSLPDVAGLVDAVIRLNKREADVRRYSGCLQHQMAAAQAVADVTSIATHRVAGSIHDALVGLIADERADVLSKLSDIGVHVDGTPPADVRPRREPSPRVATVERMVAATQKLLWLEYDLHGTTNEDATLNLFVSPNILTVRDVREAARALVDLAAVHGLTLTYPPGAPIAAPDAPADDGSRE